MLKTGEARGALAISLGQASLMIAGGLLALLITQYFGKGAGSDAFFTAYGFYVIAVAFAQTLRLTALPRLSGDVNGEDESRLLAATISLALLAALPMLVFAGPLGELIADGDPTGVAARTLRLLWPALALHLAAGVLVPMLTLRSIYTPVGLALGLASLAGVVTFVLLQPELGIDAVATGLAVGAALLAASLATTLVGGGWRPSLRAFSDLRAIASDSWSLALSSSSFLIVNVGYLICLAVANHGESGLATTYAYAFFAAAFLVATTAIPGALVRVPRLLDAESGRGVTTDDVTADFRFALVLIAPAVGLAALLAAPAIDGLAGSFFDGGDAVRLVTSLLALTPWVLASVAGVLVVLELLNRGRARVLAVISATQAVALVPLAVAGRELAGILGIALAQSLAMSAATFAQLRVAFGDRGAELALKLARESIAAALVVTVSFGPGIAVVQLVSGTPIVVVGMAAISFSLYAAVASRTFNREWRTLLATVRRSSGDDL